MREACGGAGASSAASPTSTPTVRRPTSPCSLPRGAARRSSSGGRSSAPSPTRSSQQGGTITHHHAVGRDHRPWYDRQRPEPFALALRGAKAAVDPAGDHEPRRADRSAGHEDRRARPRRRGRAARRRCSNGPAHEVVVVARESTVAVIAEQGCSVQQRHLRRAACAHPRAVARLEEPVDALIVATKAAGLEAALERIATEPAAGAAAAQRPRPPRGAARALRPRRRCSPARSASRPTGPSPGLIVHTSPFLLVNMAAADPAAAAPMRALGGRARDGRACRSKVLDSEAEVMWSKLVRLNALACTTSAYDKLLGEIRSTPELRADLVGAIEEALRGGAGRGRHGRRRRAGRSPSSSGRTPRSAARCSATSRPGASPSSTRSPARCCARRRATGCSARRSSGWWR